jgi:hypothetical protein
MMNEGSSRHPTLFCGFLDAFFVARHLDRDDTKLNPVVARVVVFPGGLLRKIHNVLRKSAVPMPSVGSGIA